MVDSLSDLFPILLISAVAAFGVSPVATRIASRLALIDRPGSAAHKLHRVPTPLAGGIVLFIGVLLAYVLVRPPLDREILGTLVAGAAIFIVGLLDDRFTLSPLLKFSGQLSAALILILFGVQVRITGYAGLDLFITFLWILGITNAFNFVDSMDGLALGLGGISAAFFMLVTLDSAQPNLAILSAALLGASFGTYFLNAAPAKLFLGDSGAQLIGTVLAAIGIAYTPAQAGLPQGVTWFTPILVLGVPIFDATLVVFSRVRKKRAVYRASMDHTYHRLVKLGLDPTRATLAMQLLSVLLGLVAFIALDASVLAANIIFGGLVLIGFVAIVVLEERVSD